MCKSIPIRTRSVSDMLPTSFRRGGGSSLTSVGAATDLPILGENWLLVDVDHFELISACQVCLAYALDILNGLNGLRVHTCDEKAQDIFFLAQSS